MHIVSLSFFTYRTYISKVREGFCSLKISARQALATYLLLNQSFNPRDFPESAQIWISNLFLRWKKARRDRNTGKKTFSFISHFFHFDSRIDLPLKVPLSLTQLCLALSLSPPSQPLLQKMACTLGLLSNYGSTFSEKVIIIRDPFSFSVKSAK